ncbi:MAG: DUF2459 domain-containing protein [Nostocaceae cyanobacterium]|nr:DUF2459 domain-containing protein [Nostocaceae cyanobacterium]
MVNTSDLYYDLYDDKYMKRRQPRHNHCSLYLFFLLCLRSSFVFLAFLIAAALFPRKWKYISGSNCNFEVCVNNTGFHSNLIVKTKNDIFDWHNYLDIDEIGLDDADNYKYLSFGWGDRDFYMSTPRLKDIKFMTSFKALFLPTSSVMYVQGYEYLPKFAEIKCIKIQKNDYLQIINYIQASFQLDSKNRTIRVGNGHTPNAGFYRAKGSYSILKNCNSWTAQGLRTADVNTPLWDGLPAAIIWHLKSSCK